MILHIEPVESNVTNPLTQKCGKPVLQLPCSALMVLEQVGLCFAQTLLQEPVHLFHKRLLAMSSGSSIESDSMMAAGG